MKLKSPKAPDVSRLISPEPAAHSSPGVPLQLAVAFVGLTNLNSVNGGGRLFPYGRPVFNPASFTRLPEGGKAEKRKKCLQFIVYTRAGIVPLDKVRQLLAPEVTTWRCTFDPWR